MLVLLIPNANQMQQKTLKQFIIANAGFTCLSFTPLTSNTLLELHSKAWKSGGEGIPPDLAPVHGIRIDTVDSHISKGA